MSMSMSPSVFDAAGPYFALIMHDSLKPKCSQMYALQTRCWLMRIKLGPATSTKTRSCLAAIPVLVPCHDERLIAHAKSLPLPSGFRPPILLRRCSLSNLCHY